MRLRRYLVQPAPKRLAVRSLASQGNLPGGAEINAPPAPRRRRPDPRAASSSVRKSIDRVGMANRKRHTNSTRNVPPGVTHTCMRRHRWLWVTLTCEEARHGRVTNIRCRALSCALHHVPPSIRVHPSGPRWPNVPPLLQPSYSNITLRQGGVLHFSLSLRPIGGVGYVGGFQG